MCVWGGTTKLLWSASNCFTNFKRNFFVTGHTACVYAGVCWCWLIILFLLHSRKFAWFTTQTHIVLNALCAYVNHAIAHYDDYDYFFGFLNFFRGTMTSSQCLHKLTNERGREMKLPAVGIFSTHKSTIAIIDSMQKKINDSYRTQSGKITGNDLFARVFKMRRATNCCALCCVLCACVLRNCYEYEYLCVCRCATICNITEYRGVSSLWQPKRCVVVSLPCQPQGAGTTHNYNKYKTEINS